MANANSNYLKVLARDRSRQILAPAESEAEAFSSFIPAQDTLTLHFMGKVDMHESENEVSFELQDAAGRPVRQKKWTTEMSPGLNIQEDCVISNLDTQSTYKLRLYAKVSCGDVPGAESVLEVSF